MYVHAVRAGPAPTARRRSASRSARIEENASRRTRARASTALCGNQPVSQVISAPRSSERPKLGHDLREIHSTESSEPHLTQTTTNLKLKHNLNFDVPTGTAGSTRTARRPCARRRAATAATARGPILVLVLPNGLVRTAEPRSVTRNARTAVDVWHQIPASARPSGTATTAGCPYVIRASSRLMEPPKPGRACPKVTPRSDLIRDQEPGPCTGRASSRRGATRRKASTARSRSEPIV